MRIAFLLHRFDESDFMVSGTKFVYATNAFKEIEATSGMISANIKTIFTKKNRWK